MKQEKQNEEKKIIEDTYKSGYKKGYNYGFKNAQRIKRRLLRVKAFIREAWALLTQMKE